MIPVLDCTVEKDNLERFYTQDHFNVILRNSIILLKKSDNMDCKWRNTEGRVITITPTPTRSALVRHYVETPSNSASPGRVQSGAIPAGRRWWQRSKVRSTEYNIYISRFTPESINVQSTARIRNVTVSDREVRSRVRSVGDLVPMSWLLAVTFPPREWCHDNDIPVLPPAIELVGELTESCS